MTLSTNSLTEGHWSESYQLAKTAHCARAQLFRPLDKLGIRANDGITSLTERGMKSA